jgi:hypothetical protein
MQNTNIQISQNWANCWVDVLNNQSNVQLDTPAFLANTVLSLEFYNGDTPVTTGISGVLTVAKQWKIGRIQAPAQYQLSGTDAIQLDGLSSRVYLSLSGLTGCDRIVVNSVQYINQIGS